MKADFTKRGYSFILLVLGFFTSCSKTEITDNIVMDQAFSIPLGEKEVDIQPPDWETRTSVPGIYGTFYYNGYPYQINTPYFQKEEKIDFKIDNTHQKDWIYRIDFKIRLENSYPFNTYFQVYLLNSFGQVTDSIFAEGPQKAPAGKVNDLDEVQETSSSVFDSGFEGERLDHLKSAKILSYNVYLETRRDDGELLRYSYQSNIKVNLAMRLFMKYNLNEI